MAYDDRAVDVLALHGVPTGFGHFPAKSDDEDNIYRGDANDARGPIVGMGLRLTAEGNVSILDGNGHERIVACVAPPNDIPVGVSRIRSTGTTVPDGHIAVYVSKG